MNRLVLALCIITATLGTPGTQAQDLTYTPDDAALMQACLEPIRTTMGDLETTPAKTLPDCIGAASDICMGTPEGGTTIGMSQCMARERIWWDEQLNTHYSALRESLDEESFTALREAQRKWIDFRDETCAFEYTFWREGTIRSIFYGSCMLDITARRAIDLEGYLGWMN